ncbi:anaerobic ribonucleoside-triphosphate reductase activating protein [Cellulosilyticum sp. I15G10I2]|uniref:anaerobic ribonucleoside-triphosphate reductase activating protein n=1 Tax=Cellulosilyticum sp. I15G10I2 TaxID=1892843 RepID=UPI00085C8CD6|nr:anaerobic ribonucleoside-triphosphate reductase activating protein [Cellulosilyticum sp. I15G10I2]
MISLRVAGFLDHSTVNGEGFRSVLFLSGCHHNCLGCHNKLQQDFAYGEDLPITEIIAKISKNKRLLDGVTISGGEPFEQSENLRPLLGALKKLDLSIWVYTGYLYEDLTKDPIKSLLLPFIDVLVDGPYIEAYADANLKYRGSSNQRFLNLTEGKISAYLTY